MHIPLLFQRKAAYNWNANPNFIIIQKLHTQRKIESGKPIPIGGARNCGDGAINFGDGCGVRAPPETKKKNEAIYINFMILNNKIIICYVRIY